LVRKTIYTQQTKGTYYRREDEVVQFKECSPGVFFPERLVGGSGPEGDFNFHHHTLISDIRVNQPLPENIFHLRYPEGIPFDDHIRGVKYRANSEGNPISKEEPLRSGRVIPAAPLGDDPPRETQEEPKSATRWILPVSGGILVIGLAAAFVRRRWKMTAAR